jgi:tRNA nucleotidyltransferase/poly(A) polymerase
VRRDFTINALYLDVRTQKVLDPLGLRPPDLEDKFIRTTHPDSFRDDPLRTLRALRFLSKLDGFMLSGACTDQMKEHAEHVTGLTAGGYASGTVLQELAGILMGRGPASRCASCATRASWLCCSRSLRR